MRALALAALATVALVASATGTAGASGVTALTVTYWEDGSRPGTRDVWTLRCDPARGTLSRPPVACRRLADAGSRPFAPTRGDTACTQIYGGPQKARVVGTVEGERVWATFTRTDGCAIARWNRLSPWLLPAGGLGS